MKLNLGCGRKRIEGYEGVDLFSPEAEHHVDLFRFPWPWADSQADAVCALNFLEHVPDLTRTMREIVRILKPGGELWFRSPHWKGSNATQLDHRSFLGWGTCDSLEKGYWLFDCEARFDRRLLRLYVAGPVNWLANLRPSAWEKLGVCAPEEIEWRGVLIKDGGAGKPASAGPRPN